VHPLGQVENPALHVVSPALADWRLLPAPYRIEGGTTTALLTNVARTEVLALAIDADGTVSEVGRAETPTARLQAFVQSPLHGSFYAFVADGPEGSTLQAVHFVGSGPPRVLWESPRAIVSLATIVNRREEPALLAATREDVEGHSALHTRLFQGPDLTEQSEGPSFELPPDVDLHLGLGVDGGVHVLARSQAGETFYGSGGGPLLEVGGLKDLQSEPGLVVGFKQAAFAYGITRERGVAIRPLGVAPQPR
jgi:hypothetical protein